MKYLFVKIFVFCLIFNVFSQTEPQPLSIEIPQGQPVSVSISHDGLHLLLETVTDTSHIFFEYKKQGNNWVKPVKTLEARYIAAPVFNHDNNRIYFEADFGKGNTDLFYIERTSDGWSKPVALDSLNTVTNEHSPSIDPFSGRIFFTRDNPDEKDCRVIYFSKLKNGRWTKPQRFVIPGISGCEFTPRLLYDGKTLIFAGKPEDSKSLDLLFTKELTEGVWYVPKPVKGCQPKLYEYSPAFDYRSDRIIFIQTKSNFKHPQLMQMPIPSDLRPDPVYVLSGKIKNLNTKKLIKANIDVLNPTTNAPIARYSSFVDGYYEIFLQPDKNYILTYSGKNLSMFFKNLKIDKLKGITFDTSDVELFDRVKLQLNVFDSAIFQPLDVSIKVKNLSNGQIIDTIHPQTIEQGRYVLTIPVGRKYRFSFSNQYYKPDSLDFDLSGTVIYSSFEKDIELASLTKRVVIHVVDAITGQGIQTEVELINRRTKEHFHTTVKTDKNGNVVLFLRKGDVYELNITPRGYTFFHSNLDLEEDTVPSQVVAKVKPLTVDTKLEFHNITFETNSAELNQESFAELDRLVELMKKNPNIKVEISAHTDDVGSEAYNLKLSQRRAQAVVDYLKQHGIPEDRMIAKGYGETQPLVPNDSPEHRAMNRRVEFKILKVNQ